MRIPSGKTDQSIYFVAVDATDLKTRETGLSSFTVQRSRNGAAEVAMTTPTIVEIDAANMPGVYALLLDEDTTIASSSDSEEMCLHITHAGMAPVTRTVELYRRAVTSGRTLGIEASGALTAIANGAIVAATFAANALDAVWSTAARVLTAGTNIVLAKGTGVTGFNDLDAAGVRGAVGLASANLDTQLGAIAGFIDTEIGTLNSNVTTILGHVDTEIGTLVTNVGAILGHVDTEMAAVLAIANKLDTGLELDGGVWRWTINALEQAPAGGGGGGGLTQAQVREAVGLAAPDLDAQFDAIVAILSGGADGPLAIAGASLEVVNLALSLLREEEIADLLEDTKPAREARKWFGTARDETLRAYDWNFAEAWASPAADPSTQAGPLKSRYPLPADCLKVRHVEGLAEDQWKVLTVAIGTPPVETSVLVTNAAAPEVCYTRVVTNVSQWDAQFVVAFARRLAAYMASAFGKSIDEIEGMEKLGERKVDAAKREDARERAPTRMNSDTPFVRARRGWRRPS